jgi:hypothetical protein
VATIRRLVSQAKAGRSHYQFKDWTWDHLGQRQAPKIVCGSSGKGQYADLINTCYYNPGKRTHTLYCIALDLDAHRAKDEWKTKQGSLKWARIKRYLQETHPELFHFVFAVVRSTGGKGLAIYFAVAPLELRDSNQKAQRAAKALLEQLLDLFNRIGLGADPSAVGLKRDFCNWRNSKKTLFQNLFVLKSVQSDSYPVIKELLRYLKPFKLAPYVKKSSRLDLLYSDQRAETKLAHLYQHLYKEALDGESTLAMSVKKIMALTALSRPFVEKLLKKPPRWLKTEYLNREEGWDLTICLDRDLSQRASQLLTSKVSEQNLFGKSLIKPEKVKDGFRNHWITHACLILKHSGQNKAQAIKILEHHIRSIPGFRESRNCRHFKSIVKSVYGSKKELFSVKPGSAPQWLLEYGHSNKKQSNLTQIKSAIVNKNSSLQTIFKKGGYTPKALPRLVSRDQCFIFQKNYYSVPACFVGSKIWVYSWNGSIKIYDDKNRYVACHRVESTRKGRYVYQEQHFLESKSDNKKLFGDLLLSFQQGGKNIGAFSRSLVWKYKQFSLRRLWLLKSLVKKHGYRKVDAASCSCSNLAQLVRTLE